MQDIKAGYTHEYKKKKVPLEVPCFSTWWPWGGPQPAGWISIQLWAGAVGGTVTPTMTVCCPLWHYVSLSPSPWGGETWRNLFRLSDPLGPSRRSALMCALSETSSTVVPGLVSSWHTCIRWKPGESMGGLLLVGSQTHCIWHPSLALSLWGQTGVWAS